MAYRMTAQIQVYWVGPGLGPMGGQLAPPLPQAPAGGAQVVEIQNSSGGYNSLTFTSGDITNLLAALTTDISAQLNAAALLSRIQNFSTGQG